MAPLEIVFPALWARTARLVSHFLALTTRPLAQAEPMQAFLLPAFRARRASTTQSGAARPPPRVCSAPRESTAWMAHHPATIARRTRTAVLKLQSVAQRVIGAPRAAPRALPALREPTAPLACACPALWAKRARRALPRAPPWASGQAASFRAPAALATTARLTRRPPSPAPRAPTMRQPRAGTPGPASPAQRAASTSLWRPLPLLSASLATAARAAAWARVFAARRARGRRPATWRARCAALARTASA